MLKPHRFVRSLFRIGYAVLRIAEAGTKVPGELGRADDDEAHGDTRAGEIRFDLTQLRERLSEEGSTDVAQPDDERRQRNT